MKTSYKPMGFTVSALIKELQKIEKTNPRAKVYVPTYGTKEWEYTLTGWCSLEYISDIDKGVDKDYPHVIIGGPDEEYRWDK